MEIHKLVKTIFPVLFLSFFLSPYLQLFFVTIMQEQELKGLSIICMYVYTLESPQTCKKKLPQISMSVTVTMVVVSRHALTKMEATDAPVNLDIQEMVLTVQVIFFVWLYFFDML